jgi:RNA polymerase sigma-70 factor (ECF subfamily)
MTFASTSCESGQTALIELAFDGWMQPASGSAAARPEHRVMAKAEPDARDIRLSALMASAQTGDRAAYSFLLRECVPVIRAAAARRAPADRIDDVVQEALLTLHNARHTYDPSRSFVAWLSVIADRRAIDLMRRVVRDHSREVHAPVHYEQHADPGANPETPTEQAETRAQMRQAVKTLPPRQREAIEQVVLAERSLREASSITGQTDGSIKVSLHRALRALRLKTERESR